MIKLENFIIIKTNDNIFRYINHNLKLLTIGYTKKENLIKNKDIIRIDSNTLELMKIRYNKFINNI